MWQILWYLSYNDKLRQADNWSLCDATRSWSGGRERDVPNWCMCMKLEDTVGGPSSRTLDRVISPQYIARGAQVFPGSYNLPAIMLTWALQGSNAVIYLFSTESPSGCLNFLETVAWFVAMVIWKKLDCSLRGGFEQDQNIKLSGVYSQVQRLFLRSYYGLTKTSIYNMAFLLLTNNHHLFSLFCRHLPERSKASHSRAFLKYYTLILQS